MAIVQGVVERKLSALIGAKVTFQTFHFSLLTGTIEAAGMRVGDNEASPLLTIVLVRIAVSIKSALKGEIVVKSITVEKPVLALTDANLPHPPATAHDSDDKTTWMLDVQKLFIIDGQANLRRGSYELATGRILAELNRAGDDYVLTFLAENVRRVDREAMIGTVSATGRITGAADLTMVPEAGMTAEITIGDLGRIGFATPRILSLDGEIELRGKITLAQLAALLPPRLG
jgi:hypothetical protein